MTALFAHLPEGLIIAALMAVVAGIALPIWERLGFGWWSSASLAVLSGIVVVGFLMVISTARNALAQRRDGKTPPDATG